MPWVVMVMVVRKPLSASKPKHSHVKGFTHRPKISHIIHAFTANDTTPLEMFSNMQRSQRKRCAPSWLKQKPYLKIRFTQDGVTTKVTESWRIKLRQYSQELSGSLANYSFRVGQLVWCYWKTANEKEKALSVWPFALQAVQYG